MADYSDTLVKIYFAATVIFIFCVQAIAVLYERRRRETSPHSARFLTVSASSNLLKKIDPLAGSGVHVWVAAGAGLYLHLVDAKRRGRFINAMLGWLAEGTKLTVLITCPKVEGVEAWQKFVDQAASDNLEVLIFDRKQTSGFISTQIEALDTFHPTLVERNGQGLAMWVENYHAPNSTVANDVDFVAAEDLIDFQAARFLRYLNVFKKISKRGPHVTRLVQSSQSAKGTEVRLAS